MIDTKRFLERLDSCFDRDDTAFDYFQRPIEAQALRDVAQEIYESNRK